MGKRRMEYFETLENSNDGLKKENISLRFKPSIPKFHYSIIPAFNPFFQHSIIPMG
jgi:hypothetical protein